MHFFATGLVLALVFMHAANAAPRMHKRVFQYPSHVPVQHGSFIVEFDDHMVHTHADNLNSMSSVSVHKRFTDGFHGAVVATSKHITAEILASAPGVKRIWPNRKHALGVYKGKRDITSPYLHEMTGVAQAAQELGADGTGVKVCIVDSGVDYNHPELGGCWKTDGCPWQLGQDFIGDKYDNNGDNPTIEPNDTPMDCYGHGTHVAGIIAGRGPQVRGVAPNATMGMYRTYSCPSNGTLKTDDSIIMQGMIAALKDGCNVVNLSLGAVGWPEDPISVLASNMVSKGTIVVAANGNDGYDGLQTANSPAVGYGVISVGSVDNWNVTSNATLFSTPNGDRYVQISAMANNAAPFIFDEATPLVLPTDDNGNFYGCSAPDADYSGSIAVVMRGECMFTDKAFNMQSKGAVAVVIINNENEAIPINVELNVTIPCVTVAISDGEFIVKGIAAGSSTVKTDHTQFTTFDNPTGGQMSVFSSYGPNAELGLEPLISAPGGDIWSTYPVNLGSYASMSGTSMATPYITGCVALLRQKFPDYSVDRIRQLLVNSASPVDNSNTGLKISPFRSGAGLVNVYSALNSRVFIDPPFISINNTDSDSTNDQGARVSTYTLNFTNSDPSKGVNVALSNHIADSLSLYDADGNYAQSILDAGIVPTWPNNTEAVSENTMPQVSIPDGSQHVAAGQSVQFNVSITSPFGLEESARWFYGGFLNFTIKFDDETDTMQHVVPYGGFNGNYSNIDMLSPPSSGYPLFFEGESTIINDISTFKFDAANPPGIAFSLDVPPKFLYAAYIDSDNKTVGVIADSYGVYAPRNIHASNPFFTIMLNNTIVSGKDFSEASIIASGKYRVRFAILRPFGDYENDADYQMWDSAEFTID